MTDIADQPPPAARPDLKPAWEGVIEDFRARHDYIMTRDVDAPASVVAFVVLADMAERDKVGRERYGVPLTAHNGRDQLVDAYQELQDAAAYLRAAKDEGHDVGYTYGRVLDSLLEIRILILARRVPA